MLQESGHAFVHGYLKCSPTSNYQHVLFMIDTGCSVTTLLPNDVARLSINCALLQQTNDDINTANGVIHPYVYPEPELRFLIQYGWFNRKLTFGKPPLNFIYCAASATANPVVDPNGYSVLGQDILHFFKKWHHDYRTRELRLQS
jgi:hypothetical protein